MQGHNDTDRPTDLSGIVGASENNYFSAGGFSTVWLGYWSDPDRRPKGSSRGENLAIKAFLGSRLPDVSERFARRVVRETQNWHRLRHPNVLPLYGICYDRVGSIPDYPALVSPYLALGNIMGYTKRDPRINRLQLLHQAAAGLDYLHSVRFVHGDLKGSNILIKDNGQACICDFGRTMLAGDDDYSRSLIASAHWAAPELLNTDEVEAIPISFASDVWAFGMVVLEVISGRRPWGRMRDFAVLQLVAAGMRPEHINYPEVSLRVWRAVEPCWETVPEDRPTIREIRNGLPFE